MGIHRGPNTVKDGLVFGYDTGYGVADNSTATRFYPGEATANIFSNPNFANHTDVTVGTTSVIKQDFGDGRIGIQMIQAGTSDIAGFSMGSYSAPVSAGTYTWSSFIHSTSTGGKVKAQITVYVNGTRHWLTNSNTWTTSVTECSHLFIATVANQWHRIENQFTLPTGTLTNLQLGSFYRTTSNFTIKIANAQLELKSHTTPFVDGTRSSTASLIDLKKTANIDVSNVSFDSTGQPDFDGSNDYIYIDEDILNVSSFTVEAIVNITSTGNNNKPIFTCGNLSSTGIWFFKHRSGLGNRLVMHGYDGVNPRVDITSTNVVPDAENAYVAVTFNGTSYQLYINGVADGNSVSDNAVAASNDNYIGRQSSSGTYLLGDVPVLKIYNKALTATEIKQNYNAYKNRFDI